MSHWVDWKLTNLDSGYMYCCSVEDAAKAIQATVILLLDLDPPGNNSYLATKPPARRCPLCLHQEVS